MSDWTDEELHALERRIQAVVERSVEVQNAEALMRLVSGEVSRRELIAGWVAAPPPEQGIDLPPEFSQLLESSGVRDTHERFQREPVDPAWSLQMEANFRNFYASRPQITATFGVPTINCRTSACEIAFVAYGIDTSNRGRVVVNAFLDGEFRRANAELQDQPWTDELTLNRSPSLRHQNGTTAFLWHVRKCPHGAPGCP